MFKDKNITDLFFDLDHTLWDFEKNSALAFKNVFEHHKIEMDLPGFLKIYEPINFEYWKRYRDEEVTKQELRRGRLTDTFNQLKLEFPLEMIDAMAVSYIDFLPNNNYLFEGTIELLDFLKPNFNLHIITNGFEEVQFKKLKNSNIDSYFKTVTNSERVGVKKPNPKIFQHALQFANATPQNSVMIGDNFEADILGAKAVGMHTLYFNPLGSTNEEHPTVQQLLEIKKLF
ncbi:YjjG family noncanonical pyrimidine nucleotidase [Planktosalinus lacus]|uniref:Noncanonical pyrimidine nucleotidase, YjjG family protein n=1 Tax=Planktosalinus lacus TaxID=1526573 RepID=A0A8J2Y7F1_9FLAO|nr:YjjG family noncanonical pyrimidine nucleotidase [Planktosalinus lacus]GGD87400.1 noncanonical pyrimidine nucleotidase, YjjG family protein [Planktosalinus lacus]